MIAASLLLTVSGLTKVTGMVFAPAFVIAALCDRSQSLHTRIEVALALSIGIVLAVGAHLSWNAYRFGDPSDFGYHWALETIPQLPARQFMASDVPRGLVVLRLSPGKSIFVWAPVLLVAVARGRRFFQTEPAVAIGVATAVAVGLVFYAAYLFPEGGYSHGPRNLVPIIPLMMLPAAGQGSRWSAALLIACAAVGLMIALLAVSVSFLEDQGLGDLGPGARTV